MKKETVLICPLDWGLGHAARCVPVIKELLRLNFKVIIGADKNPLAFLMQEFPDLETIVVPGYEVTYDEKGSFFKLFTESVRFNKYIKIEQGLIDKIIEDHRIDVIISDNRYGLWSKSVKSILITHQIFPKVPIGSSVAYKKIEQLIGNFDECWIPDMEETPNLSGDLSHLKHLKQTYRFIGSLSRFSKLEDIVNTEIGVFGILSGPEPQRSIFEKILIEQLENSNIKAVLVRGLPNASKELKNTSEDLKIFNHLSTNEFLRYFQKSKAIVCRSGYSSIMDLATLGKQAILIPTPGQTEQEYLAEYHLQQGNFYTQKQSKFNLEKGLIEMEKYSPNIIASTNLSFL